MLNILINAYAVSPNWGSEPGMGWNWVVNLANYCNLHIITEGEWKDEISSVLKDAKDGKHPMISAEQANRMHFYYNEMTPEIRTMCWNQGDWRFYYYYRKWQEKTLKMAREIIEKVQIDIVHQLNMIGYREPGMLWKIDNRPFVWGPFGGLEMMPLAYLEGECFKIKFFSRLKNFLNDYQRKHDRRFHQAIKRADGLCNATKGVYEYVKSHYRIDTVLLNETGCYVKNEPVVQVNKNTFDLVWVGKFDFRKQLSIALNTVAHLKDLSQIRLHILGDGYASDVKRYKQLSHDLGIDSQIVWYGKIPNKEVQKLMSNSDLLLFTSIMEGTPHVVMEALGNNLPVICLDLCGQGDCINESCGIKIPVTNPRQSAIDFANAVRKLVMYPEKLYSLKCNCYQRQLELSWDQKVKVMLEVYENAIHHFEQHS